MLNPSDKELDRLSKEAAQEYDPGDVLGQGSWEKLEIRLDRDLGRLPTNPLRHIRRFPFYYAPALLVLIGASYFFVRQGTKGSGGPPGQGKQTETAVVKNISSSKTPESNDKLNSTPAASSVAPTSPAATGTSAGAVTPSNTAANPAPSSPAANPALANPAPNLANTGLANPAPKPANTGPANAGATNPRTTNSGHSTIPALTGTNTLSRTGNHPGHQTNNQNFGYARNGGSHTSGHNSGRNSGGIAGASITNAITGNATSSITPENTIGNALGNTSGNTSANPAAANHSAANRELTRSTLGPLSRTKDDPYINDSALRHFNLKTGTPQITYKALHINRALEFGILLAPDFASVNALAGDKAGSTIGATVDYQFANRWYIGSGLLLDRKNYAARAQDFATPPPNIPITQNVINHMQYVKGSFELLEIPLNLRYDFSVAGNTLFFASGGISSYLFTSEHNGIYYFDYGRLSCDQQKSPTTNSYLFSSLHFSFGVETGLSNSLSLLIAPYAELPMRGIGMGQVQMSSVGINFSLHFAPVTSRKRY